jgi:hypothetical protein
MTKISSQGAIQGLRDASVQAPLRDGPRRRRMLLAGLMVIVAIAPPAASAAYAGSSLIRRTADINREQIGARERYNEVIDSSIVKGLGPVEIFLDLYDRAD